ncbi:MAG TPA: hypothetical protein VGG89_01560 [Candidatus Baltobacteraceae bacterium]|jgi:hypothetical protein
MSRTLAVLIAAMAGGAAVLLSGCTAGSSQGDAETIPVARPMAQLSGRKAIPKDLFIANYTSSTADGVQVYGNRHYRQRRTITNGIKGAQGLWIDTSGNLYVANSDTANVTEYAPGGTSPMCTYSKKLGGPTTETTDSAGNVYVVDFNHFKVPGYIDEYRQCGNSVVKRYSIITPPTGVAIDSKGDIFVAYITVAGGAFEEFKKGEKTPTELNARIGSPAGLLIDGKGNLIADDQRGNIDVIPPPYKKVNTLVSGLYNPFRAALNKDQTLLYNVDSGEGTVSVYQYPSGKLVKVLGTAEGVTNPSGVAISPNAVF